VDDAPGPIRVAVGHLSGVPGVALESPPECISAESVWAIQLRLTSARFSDFVPEETRWVVLVDSSYPAGRIRIFPAQQGGLVHTFPHQDRNVVSGKSHATWRTGKPCLDSPSQRLGRIAGGPEPRADAGQRLRWHVERCLAWLEVAAVEQLMVDDEPFEVPQCPSELLDTRFTIVHDEGDDTWSTWDDHVGRYGEVRWAALPGFENTIVAEEFYNACGERIRASRRGARLSGKPWVGYWWLWPSPIVIPPWHAPGTWAELRRTGETIKVDVDAFLRWMACRARGQEAVIALLGYPIPTLWNGAPVEVHWQAILPPKVPKKIKPMDGFRGNQRGRDERLRRDIFRGNRTLSYLRTANWHPDRLQARGGLPSAIRGRSVAVVGTGALGSAVVEILARGGVAKILVVDHDDLEAGNLVRHTLTGAALGHNKADAVAARLQGVAPMSRIASHAARLPRDDELQALLEPFDVVIDATGEDEVLRRLGEAWWAVPRRFLSVSLGFAAHRLFLFGAQACSFPFEEFEGAMRPWLDEERSQWTDAGETLEGAGCWSPLFPARSDDVWLAAVTTVKHMERAFGGEFPDGLRVLEQRADGVVGFQPVEFEEGT
jgi:hypothetical protein